jgi:hypothetical protein
MGNRPSYVNGELDNRSLGHSAYQGKEEIIIGNASFGWKAFFQRPNGSRLAIWSRPLGIRKFLIWPWKCNPFSLRARESFRQTTGF